MLELPQFTVVGLLHLEVDATCKNLHHTKFPRYAVYVLFAESSFSEDHSVFSLHYFT